jgi:hypothetical protein
MAKATKKQLVDAVMPSATEIIDLLIQLEHVIQKKTFRELAKADKGTATQYSRAYAQMYDIVKRWEEVFKPFKNEFEQIKTVKLPSAMEREGVSTISLDDMKKRITVSSRFTASIKPDMKEEAYEWLRNNGLEDLITNTVNASTLSAAAKNMMEEKNKELPADKFNLAIIPTTSVTAIKGK